MALQRRSTASLASIRKRNACAFCLQAIDTTGARRAAARLPCALAYLTGRPEGLAEREWNWGSNVSVV